MFRSILFLFILHFLLLLLAACNKDDDGNQLVEPLPIDPLEVEISDEKRMEVLQAVNVKFDELSNLDRKTANVQLISFLKTIPSFEEAGLSADQSNVWGRFTDGQFLIITNNRTPTPNTNPDNLRIGYENETPSNARLAFPGTSKAVLMNAMGNYYVTGQTNLRAIEFIFREKGYQVSKQAGSIDNLKSIKDAGVFYFSTHGGYGKLRDSTAMFGLWTTDQATLDNNKMYRDELKKGNLCYMLAYQDRGPNGRPVGESHYGITHKFVDKYMGFAANALLYLDACSSFSDQDIQYAFLNKTSYTGTYVGWTNPVGDEVAYQTAKRFLDRLLGANDSYAQPESPNQRSFDIKLVFDEMVKKDIGKYVDSENNNRTAFLTYKAGTDENIFLRPSISFVGVDELNQLLYIYGAFGEDPGQGIRTVTVDGVELEVLYWDEKLVQCKIKPTGKGSAGDVVVSIREHKSHPRTLTEWRGAITFTREAEGTLNQKATFHVHLRADAHRFRKKPGETPVPIWEAQVMHVNQSFARDSKAIYSVSGSGSNTWTNGCKVTNEITWNNKEAEIGLMDLLNANPMEQSFHAMVNFVQDGFQINNLHLNLSKVTSGSLKVTSLCPDGDTKVISSASDVSFTKIPEQLTSFKLELDSRYNIKANKKVIQLPSNSGLVYGGPVPNYPVTLEWGNIQAAFLPNPHSGI